MLPAFTSLHFLPVLCTTILGFMLGWVWYSPLLFVKPWMKEMGFTVEQMKKPSTSQGMMMLGGAFLITVVSTIVLAMIINSYRIHGVFSGIKMGLFVGLGLVAARQGVNAIFQMKSLKLFLIVAGHDIVLLALQGAILGVWR